MTVLEFSQIFLQPYATRGSEVIPTYCPLCHGGDSRDKHSFALNIESKTYNCKRGSCGAQGHFVELCKEFGVEADSDNGYKPTAKTYSKPEEQPKPVHEAARLYIKSRGISEETSTAYKIGTDENGNLFFPFFDEDGTHIFSKYRYPRKLKKGERKAWREAGTKPILFGMHLCDPTKPLTITEGEFDAMVCHEAEIPNAVSIPSGAEDFTWVDTCWDFLAKFTEIYLFGDNDAPGQEMIRKLSAKLADRKIFIVNHEHKDANELLHYKGKQAVFDAWQNAKEVPVAGLIRLADVAPIDVKSMPKIRTSISQLNRLLGGFYYGNVTVITGRRGEGKSTFVSQLLLDAIDKRNRVCAYSGELRADQFQYWSDLQAAGRHNTKDYNDHANDRQVHYVEKETRKKIHDWYGDNYWIYDNSISIENEELSVLKVFELAAKRYDCRVFAIDNLMTVDYKGISEKDFYQRQSKFMSQVVNFSRLHNAHIFLVAHPRKMEGNQRKNKEITNDDISGAGDIANRADNILSLSREYEDVCDSNLSILKNRWEGTIDTIGLNYDSQSKRLYSPSDGHNYQYGWEFSSWGEVEKTEDMPW